MQEMLEGVSYKNYTMNTTPDDFLKISAKEIKHWADIEKVEAVLPDIIRNLILASSKHLIRC